jgi:hypothetical protein
MINFNEKFVKLNKTSDSWFDEMLSEMTEDVISPFIGIGPAHSAHPVKTRLPAFLGTYYQTGITEWDILANVSYAKAFGFGAYLMRNWGGAELLKKILANGQTNEASLSLALNEAEDGMSFEKSLIRYGEAFIFSGTPIPEDVCTFDRTVSKTINGTNYTVSGFDIWNTVNSNNVKGPFVFNLSPAAMRPYSITIHSVNEWKNKTGTISITLNKPGNDLVDIYLMVR